MDARENHLDRLLSERPALDLSGRTPSTTTVLLSDVVSTPFYFARHNDSGSLPMLRLHAELAAGVVKEFRGRVARTYGDAVLAEFSGPLSAVRAAAQIQRRLNEANEALAEEERVLLRLGVHTGAAVRENSDLYGEAVDFAAQLARRAGLAQILISRTVRDALDPELAANCKLLGKFAFAEQGRAEDVYEVVWTEMRAYNELRETTTDKFVRGELLSPGTRPSDFLTPVPRSSAALAPGENAAPAAAGGRMHDRYEILEELGRGGMGIVYKAVDRETGEVIALKVLKTDVAADPNVLERFKNELRLARKITHRNVCRIHDFNRSGDSVYISMEYVEGNSLRQMLHDEGRLPAARVAEIARQVCAGLAEAHRQGVVHRDLKPDNLMLAPDGTVKIMDFGIARVATATSTLTGSILGTPAYMAPEQAEGKLIDQRADVYAMGLVLYELLTGAPPFEADTPVAVAVKQIREKPVPPRRKEPSIPEAMEAAILRCLEKNPAQRFQSIVELEAALAGVTQPASPPAPPLPAPAQAPPAAASITPPAPQRAVASPEPAPISVTPHPQTGAMAAPASSSSRRLLTLAVILVVAAGAYFLGRMNKPDEAAPPAPAAEVSPSTAPPAAQVSPAPPPATLPPARPASEMRASPKTEANASPKTETKAAAPRPAAPKAAPAPATLADVKAVFIEPMENDFDKLLTTEINKQLGAGLVVVPARQMADAVLKGAGEWEKGKSSILGTRQTASAAVTLVTRSGEKELWSGQAGDRSFLRGGGPKRVAERLVRALKSAIENARK